MGVVCSIGNNAQETVASLREAKSGIVTADDYVRLGFRSQVHGSLKIDLDAVVDRRARRFQGDGAGYCWVAMDQAIRDAGLEEKDISNPRTGLIVGSGGPSTKAIVDAADMRSAAQDLQIDDEHLVVLLIVSVHRSPNQVRLSVNARAPLFVDAQRRVGAQYVFQSDRYKVQHML